MNCNAEVIVANFSAPNKMSSSSEKKNLENALQMIQ